MKIALIEPMPILNKGITLYLQRQKKVSLVKSYSKFEQFILFYADVDKCFFDLFIINISTMNRDDTERIMRIIATFFTKKDKVVLIVDKLSDLETDSIESSITLFNVRDDIKRIGKYISTIKKRC